MKRILTILIIAMTLFVTTGVGVFASTFEIEKTSPTDGATGASIDNLGVKIFFSEDVYSEENESINIDACTLYELVETEDENGDMVVTKEKEVSTYLAFNPDAHSEMMALASGTGDDAIKSDTLYKMVIDETFVSADGDTLGETTTIEFRTQNSNTTMMTSIVLMIVMVVCMVFFTTRSAKKEAEKANQKKNTAVNPYKEAKATGKSVKEIVEMEAKKKAKLEEKRKRQKAENKKELSNDNFKVSRPRPISEVGATYVHPVKKQTPKKKQPPQNTQKKNTKKKGKK